MSLVDGKCFCGWHDSAPECHARDRHAQRRTCPWGCVVGELYAQSLALVGHALDYLHAHNLALANHNGSAVWRDGEIEAFVNTGKRGFPRDEEGELAGMIHPELQGRDFLPLHHGDPIFLSHALEVD